MNDLRDLRKKVADIITESENTPILAENFMEMGSPKEVIEKKVDDCDAYLGIFDKKWGYIPADNNPEKLSVTAMEYLRSKSNRIPRLILVSKKKKEKELQAFIDKVSEYETGDWRNNYEDDRELLRLVTRGIPKIVSRIQDQYYDMQRTDTDEQLILSAPIVTPSIATYFDTIEDISNEEIDFTVEKIIHSTNSDALMSAWSDLEIFTRNKRIWKHKGVWDVLDKEIFCFDKSNYINDAIFILKGICVTSKRDNDEQVILHIKQTYAQKLEDIISSLEEKLFKSKPDVKQILEFIFNEGERFYIYWRAWKVCAKIENDHQYSNSMAAFITDLERANPKFKYSVRRELYELIENSPNSIIRKRAKEMKAFLFS